jgi:tetraacyldisaccharide 4'-kinase
MKIISVILFPFSILYGIVGAIRNFLFDKNILKSQSFDMPVISVGNLSFGGTGKTPQVEYLIRLLYGSFRIATLSRGYMRKSKGFAEGHTNSNCAEIGDEPLQYKTKFPEIVVAVCEDRCEGVKKIMKLDNNINCILLDDAFQHRSIRAGLHILLTEYSKLYYNDFVVPSGTLREFRRGARRADIILITKCPKNISEEKRKQIIGKIRPLEHQQIFFSFIEYSQCTEFGNHAVTKSFDKNTSVLLFTGIANTTSLEEFLWENKFETKVMKFPDHHQYSSDDLHKVRESFNNIASANKVIITTEKDAVRIESQELKEILKELPVYYIPIITDFLPEDKETFNKLIIDYVTNARKNQGNY